jgi:oligopeptide/dipeptide ABC transporter ATP-binding protein
VSTDRSDGAAPLLVVRDLHKHFPIRRGMFGRVAGPVRAVDGVSFDVRRGETLGLVGESGSGKTTTGRALLRLLEPTSGEVSFDGGDVLALDREGLRALRRRARIVFQDPYASLNPRMPVGSALREVLRVHRLARGGAAERRVAELLDIVGLAAAHAGRYPHEFSGGQRQRIGIARALAVQPELIVCDEPVSALDVSIQSQVINLLLDLQQRLGLSYIFISHDLAVVRHVSDRVAVMYLGRIVELADCEALYTSPQHPYTQALLSAVPLPDPLAEAQRRRIVLSGEVPSPDKVYTGCPFVDRCPIGDDSCRPAPPRLEGKQHLVSCFKAP